MKKNIMVIGMLVSLLTIPTYTFAQDVVAQDTIKADSAMAVVSTAAADTLVAPALEQAALNEAPVEEVALEEAVAPAKEKKVYQIKVDSTNYSYGSVVSAHFGFGMSGLWATQGNAQLENSWGFPGFNVGVRYSYFFLNWLGFTTGLDFSTFQSDITMTGQMNWETGIKTLAGQEYQHRLDFTEKGAKGSTWKEQEYMSMVEIPIALSFRYKPASVGFIGAAGLKLGFPVVARYSYSGTLNHTGYVKELDYLEFNDAHFMANDTYNETAKDYRKGMWSVINAEIFGEVGMIFKVHERVDLSVSLYGSYCMNDVNSTPFNEREELGFRTAVQAAKAPNMNVSFMNAYNGLIGTKAIDHINPWNCGVKIGLHFNCGKENDAERAARLAQQNIVKVAEPQIIYIRDTVTVTDTLETIVHDTVVDVHEKVTRLLEKVIIYYRSGDAKTPIINPSNLLDDAAAIIAANPQIRVSVEGHASSDGNPDFNQMLSQSRAMNVAKILREKGVQDSQIEIRAYGSDHPLTFGDQNDKNKDRRVEIIPIKQ